MIVHILQTKIRHEALWAWRTFGGAARFPNQNQLVLSLPDQVCLTEFALLGARFQPLVAGLCAVFSCEFCVGGKRLETTILERY